MNMLLPTFDTSNAKSLNMSLFGLYKCRNVLVPVVLVPLFYTSISNMS